MKIIKNRRTLITPLIIIKKIFVLSQNKINRMFNSIIESSCIVFLFQLAYVIIGISES